MATSTVQLPQSERARPLSPYALIMDFEQTIVEAVEATIAAGLARARVSSAVGERVAATWREPLLFAAADELSVRLLSGDGPRARPVTLRRTLAPYATLVAAAAETERRRAPDGFMAAD